MHVCGSLYNIFRKFTVAILCNGEKVKGLLEQRWTGHLAMATAVSDFFQHITPLLQEMVTSRVHKAETRIEVSGVYREVHEQSFLSIAKMLYKVCIAI